MERTAAFDACGARAGLRNLPFGTACFWRGGRSLCGGGAGHIPGDLYLHALPDPRGTDRVVVYARLLFFSASARRRAAFATELLGIRSDMCIKCTDKRSDRTRISGGSDRNFPPDDRKTAPFAKDAHRFEYL